MSTENKVIDLVIDENVPFGLVLQFFDVDSDTGIESPIDMTGYAIRGSISTSLEEPLAIVENFSSAIIDPLQGVVSLSLNRDQVSNLSTAAKPSRDKYSPRVRPVGFYDVILTRNSLGPDTSSTRIMEGTVSISDGVTK